MCHALSIPFETNKYQETAASKNLRVVVTLGVQCGILERMRLVALVLSCIVTGRGFKRIEPQASGMLKLLCKLLRGSCLASFTLTEAVFMRVLCSCYYKSYVTSSGNSYRKWPNLCPKRPHIVDSLLSRPVRHAGGVRRGSKPPTRRPPHPKKP